MLYLCFSYFICLHYPHHDSLALLLFSNQGKAVNSPWYRAISTVNQDLYLFVTKTAAQLFMVIGPYPSEIIYYYAYLDQLRLLDNHGYLHALHFPLTNDDVTFLDKKSPLHLCTKAHTNQRFWEIVMMRLL